MDDGLDCGDCAVFCCLACCEGACEACADSANPDSANPCACVLAVLAALALAAVLVSAFAFVTPVGVTVEEAALARFDLTILPGTTSTNTTTAGAAAADEPASSISYDISLGVALRNPNWAMRAWRAGPLDLELRFGGVPFARTRLAAAARWDRIRPRRREVYRATATAVGAPVALGSGGAAEFARERAAGVFYLEVVVHGAARYEAHPHRRSFTATCLLRLSLSTSTAPAAFARVKCT